MKLKGTLKHSKTRQADKPNPLLSFIFNLRLFLNVRCVKRTEQDGDSGHHAAAEGENDAAGYVVAVRGSNGDVEIECIEDSGCTQQRGQH